MVYPMVIFIVCAGPGGLSPASAILSLDLFGLIWFYISDENILNFMENRQNS